MTFLKNIIYVVSKLAYKTVKEQTEDFINQVKGNVKYCMCMYERGRYVFQLELKDKDDLLKQIYGYVDVDNHLGLDMSSKEQGKRIARDYILNMFELESNKED